MCFLSHVAQLGRYSMLFNLSRFRTLKKPTWILIRMPSGILGVLHLIITENCFSKNAFPTLIKYKTHELLQTVCLITPESSSPDLASSSISSSTTSTPSSSHPPAHGKDGGLVPALYQCPHCCQRFRAGNHRVRLRPKRRPAARVHGVLRREARGKRLSLAQRELLRRFRSSASKLVRETPPPPPLPLPPPAGVGGASSLLLFVFCDSYYTARCNVRLVLVWLVGGLNRSLIH